MLLLGHVSTIVSILLSKLSDCPNTDKSLCYYDYPFLTVCSLGGSELALSRNPLPWQVLCDRLAGLSRSLEAASVEKSRQEELVNTMARELKDTQDFIEVHC